MTPSRGGRRSRVLSAPNRSPAENAQLALLLEVAGTPKPGNVDRARDLADLRFEQFLAGAIGSGSGLRRAERGGRVGVAFERSVAGMSRQSGGNTQFGSLLLLTPLVKAAASASRSASVFSETSTPAPQSEDDHGGDRAGLTRSTVEDVVAATTVADAVDFYRAFEHVDVAVPDPPSDAADLDVRRGADAASAIRDRDLTLADIMALSAAPDTGIPDRNAQEWVAGFPRSFAAAESILDGDGPITDRAATAFIDLLASEPDTLVATKHGPAVAREVSQRAAAVKGDLDAASDLADGFVEEGINPGTTADITCAALFIALEWGGEL